MKLDSKSLQEMVRTIPRWNEHPALEPISRYYLVWDYPKEIQMAYYAMTILLSRNFRVDLILKGWLECTPDEFAEAMLEYDPSGEHDWIPYEAESDYKAYLQTDYWKTVRKLKLILANQKCELCHSEKQLNVHHKTYAHKGKEHAHMDDLIVLCRNCHAKFHDKLPEG